MTTHHGGVGQAGKDRDLDSHVEDTRNIDDNESTNSLETTIAFGGSETDGCLGDPLPNSQVDLNILTRDIHSLLQPSRGWRRSASGRIGLHRPPRMGITDSHTLRTQPTSTITPTEPFGPIQGHTVQPTEANKSHKFPTSGHYHFQQTRFHKIRGMVSRYRNSSRSHW